MASPIKNIPPSSYSYVVPAVAAMASKEEAAHDLPLLVAFDMGSGVIKVQAAYVDLQTGTIREPVFIGKEIVRVRGSFDSGNNIPSAVVEEVKGALKRMQTKILEMGYPIAGYTAGATQAYREAGNGEQVIAEISKNLGIPIAILSPEEEAQVGYHALEAEGLFPADKKSILVWENGGGSLQLSKKIEGRIESFNLPIGKETMRQYLVEKIQRKDREASPHPVSQEERELAIEWVKSYFKEAPDWVKQREAILGIGAMFGVAERGLKKSAFKKEELKQLLDSRIGKNDEALKGCEEPQKLKFAVSDLLFLYAVMDVLEMDEVSFKEMNGPGSTSGLLIDSSKWEHLRDC